MGHGRTDEFRQDAVRIALTELGSGKGARVALVASVSICGCFRPAPFPVPSRPPCACACWRGSWRSLSWRRYLSCCTANACRRSSSRVWISRALAANSSRAVLSVRLRPAAIADVSVSKTDRVVDES